MKNDVKIATVIRAKKKGRWILLVNHKSVMSSIFKNDMEKIANDINEAGEITDEIRKQINTVKTQKRSSKNKAKKARKRKAKKARKSRINQWKKAERCNVPELKADDPLTKFIAEKGNVSKKVMILFKGKKYAVKPRDTIRAKKLMSGKNAETVNPKWRAAVMERDNHTCQHCGSHEKLNAHHILGRASNPEMAEDINNGIILCSECHKRFHKLYGYTGFNQTDFIKFMKYDKQ